MSDRSLSNSSPALKIPFFLSAGLPLGLFKTLSGREIGLQEYVDPLRSPCYLRLLPPFPYYENRIRIARNRGPDICARVLVSEVARGTARKP